MGPYTIEDLTLLDTLPGTEAVIPDSDKAYGVQCVGLVKKYSKAPQTSLWTTTPADKVMGNPGMRKGMAIATFVDGKYPSKASGNHACFFIGFTSAGIRVLEQHVKPDPDKIQTRVIIARGEDNASVSRSNNADAYAIIK